MKKTLTLLTVLTVFLAGCDAPFWYKIPDSGNYICDEPYIEYLCSSDGDTKAILDDYDYKELVFKKQKEEN